MNSLQIVGSGEKEGVLAEALCVTKHLTIPEKWKAPIPFGQQPLVPFAKQTSLQLKTHRGRSHRQCLVTGRSHYKT